MNFQHVGGIRYRAKVAHFSNGWRRESRKKNYGVWGRVGVEKS